MINHEKLAIWLYDSWIEYMRQEDKIHLVPRSGGYVSTKPHASQLAMCAKKHAAQRLGKIGKEEFDLQTLRRIENGFRIGESVAEAVTWYSNIFNDLNGKLGNPVKMNIITEEHLENHRTAGTPDIVIDYHGLIPVEVKHTERVFQPGFSAYQVWQLISYLELTNAKVGFLFTAYPMSDDQPTSHKVWIIKEDEGGFGWYVTDMMGNYVKSDSKSIPTTWDSTVYFTRVQYESLIENHQTWEKIISEQGLIEDRPSDILDFSDWRCSKHIPEQKYQRKTGNFNVGDVKPGTGITKVRCPLFSICYPQVKNVVREETSG